LRRSVADGVVKVHNSDGVGGTPSWVEGLKGLGRRL
jgi:hypothetical protein